MSITDELREYVGNFYLFRYKDVREKLDAIADRIDAEHESACAEAYGNGVMSVPIALDESAWVELPKDADGEYIHIGDRVENNERVVRIVLTDGSWEPSVYVEKLPNVLHEYFCNEISHYHEPTVEDVLREFAQEMSENMGLYTGEAIDADEWRDADARTVEKYAERLELREVGA